MPPSSFLYIKRERDSIGGGDVQLAADGCFAWLRKTINSAKAGKRDDTVVIKIYKALKRRAGFPHLVPCRSQHLELRRFALLAQPGLIRIAERLITIEHCDHRRPAPRMERWILRSA